MEIIIIILAICSIGGSISELTNRKIEECIPLGILVTIALLYILGILNLLVLGVYIVLLLSLASFVYCIYLAITKKKEIFKKFVTPGIAALLFFIVFCVYIHNGRYIWHTDSLLHWALTVKSMIINDAISTQMNSALANYSHSPAISLFQYLWMKVYGVFNDSNIYKSLNVLAFIFLLPIFKGISWKKFYNAGSATLLIIFGITIFAPGFYTSGQVDVVVGCICAFALMEILYGKQDKFRIFVIGISLFVITLTKYTSAATSICLLIMIATKYLLDYLKFRRGNTFFNIKKAILNIGLYALIILISFLSWYVFLSVNEEKYEKSILKYQSEITQDIDKQFTNKKEDNKVPIYTRYEKFIKSLASSIKELTKIPIHSERTGLIDFGILLIILFLFLLMFAGKKLKLFDKSIYEIIIIYSVGWIAFLTSRVFIYTLAHSETVAVNSVGITRYFALFNIIILMLYIYILFNELKFKNFKINILYVSFVAIFLLSCADWNTIWMVTVNQKINSESTLKETLEYYCTISISENVDVENDSVYFISSDYDFVSANDYAFQVAKYMNPELKLSESKTFPKVGSSMYPTVLGPPRKNWGDVTNVEYSIEEFEMILYYGFSHVYVFAADQRFVEDYGQLFEDTDDISRNTIFKVKKDNGHVVLIILDEEK